MKLHHRWAAMANHNKARRLGLRAALSTALLLAVTSASAVTVDGNLLDLQTAIAAEPFSPFNVASGGDNVISGSPVADAENNGFDIKEAYAWYDASTDTFFMGMTFFGQVGTAGGNEGTPNTIGCSSGTDGVADKFDGCERYGFWIDINGNSSKEFELIIKGDTVANNGTAVNGTTGAETDEIVLTLTNTTGLTTLTYQRAVSEYYDGVEFSITGLRSAMMPMSLDNPRDVIIGFRGGTANNSGPEDFFTLQMQAVPVPAAVWLFGSGLLGLIGMARRKK